MKLILTESQINLIVEQQGLGNFMSQLDNAHPNAVYVLGTLDNFIKKSGCQHIEFANYFKHQAYGISLHDRVAINPWVLTQSLTFILYVILHEVAHQYQYKKYGMEKIYAAYVGDVSVKEGAKLMKYIEQVADEFAVRKLREFEKLHRDKIKLFPEDIKKVYQNVPLSQFENLIEKFIGVVKRANIKDKTEISNILYNYVKNNGST
jgi:predicted Zn-dependent protease with MMP-like domain